MIGDITSMQAWWNNDGVWVRPRKAGSNRNGIPDAQLVLLCMAVRRPYYRAAHTQFDAVCWFKDAYPVRAQGMGGRQVRKGKDNGEIFDHHFVEFEFSDGSSSTASAVIYQVP